MIPPIPIRIQMPVRKVLLGLFLFLPVFVKAQAVNQVYIFPSASLYAHPNSNLNIFSDISHSGSLVSYDTSLINFYAQAWQNESGSRLPDESVRGIDGIGGIFTFSGLNLSPLRIVSINPSLTMAFLT